MVFNLSVCVCVVPLVSSAVGVAAGQSDFSQQRPEILLAERRCAALGRGNRSGSQAGRR
jgi:hypothetical protein